MDKITYQLPSGERLLFPYDLTKDALFITYQLKGGKIVEATLVSTVEERTAAYRAWRDA